ncbi:hypothetical protein RSO41_17890 [Halomonas sp. I1]|uniref:hypothetical protein n=1 Tax=Halomonas sp. I1 TaxID=393536 RepID=UPI0028DDD928|nr:hypothetical protein [Halomonas sp. I1]MDT8896524.1 hypothetical protein [Halomonas sp. I1]
MSRTANAIPMNIAAARVVRAARPVCGVAMIMTEYFDDAPSAFRQAGRRRF